jgi:hypothetical protein
MIDSPAFSVKVTIDCSLHISATDPAPSYLTGNSVASSEAGTVMYNGPFVTTDPTNCPLTL